jgi:pimeloyl-ACP methyl ester carboxylesterase
VISERRQFRVLYRSFLFRVVDIELLSASGEVHNLLAQFAALLAAYSSVLALFTIVHFSQSTTSEAKLIAGAWGLEEFLISTTITVAGLFAVLAWNAMLPDRRDSFVLDPLPLQTRTIFRAKAAAIATALVMSILAVNVFTGISFPFLIVPSGAGVLGSIRCLLSYWATMAAAGGFIFFSIFALQNLAAFLSYQLFQRISGLLQLLAFFFILVLFFLTPPLATASALSSAANQRLLWWLPSYWFLGLFHELNGTTQAAFAPLAWRAVLGLAAVSVFTLGAAALTYKRTSRRVVEQPDIAPGEASGPLSKLGSALTARLLSDPIDRAILLFSARTLARSRQHRLVLAVFAGIAFSMSLAFAKSLVYGTGGARWNEPSVPLLIAGLVTLFFSIAGSRAVFALPFALPANWIFRISAVRRPAAYFAAVRKTLFVLGALPVLLGAAVLYLSIWPGRGAMQHLGVLLILAVLVVQMSLQRFRKIPFACSYLPGKSNLSGPKAGLGGILFLLGLTMAASIELWSMDKAARYTTILVLLSVALFLEMRKTAAFAGSPYNRVQFEDIPTAEIYALDLRRDSNAVNDSDYLDAISAPTPRSLGSKLRLAACACLLLLAAGFGYERLGEWRDQQRFPRVGRLVDIGGRSLNLYCAGSGSPTVVMDSGAGTPAFTWKLVEAEAARLTRACWYDRAGYGWSDPAPRARTAADVADDLHKLLHAAGVPPPYVLVGHSLGGFHVRVFAARYRDEAAGLVLVDSADEYQDSSQLPASMQSPMQYIPDALFPLIANTMRFAAHSGLVRLFNNEPKGPEDTRLVHMLASQPKSLDATLNEVLSLAETLRQVKAVRSLGSIPLIVLSGAKKRNLHFDDEADVEKLDRFMRRRVYGTQAQLAKLSTRGKQIILEHVGHGIPLDDPHSVVAAVREVLDINRNGVPASGPVEKLSSPE